VGAEDSAVVDSFGLYFAVDYGEIFSECVSGSHVDGAVDLAFELGWVDDSADVVGGDDLFDLTVFIEDGYLCCEAV